MEILQHLIATFCGSVLFYTAIPLPRFLPVMFLRIAVWLPYIGILLGILLTTIAFLLEKIGFSVAMIAILIVAFSLCITGGLHLDGVMDTADGLGIKDNLEKRLEVMSDSRTGAFGTMSAIILLSLKWASLFSVESNMGNALILAMSWGRWGQFMSIVLYDYLKKEGKGAFLKEKLVFPLDLILGTLFALLVWLWQYFILGYSLLLILILTLICSGIALVVGWWFNWQLGGHTGDSYGATVEWSEALILSVLTLFL